VTKVEEALSTTRIDPISSKGMECFDVRPQKENSLITKETKPFVTVQAAAVWEGIFACWSAEVFIPELGHRFWRLTLQVACLPSLWLTCRTNYVEASEQIQIVVEQQPSWSRYRVKGGYR